MDDFAIRIRTGDADDWAEVSDLLGHVFHETIDQQARDAEASVVEAERTLVADDAGAVVGHAAAYSRELTVPGGRSCRPRTCHSSVWRRPTGGAGCSPG
nr:hypothetical protein GCM10020092_092520 [Actinoplanes digitatis]